MASRSRSAEQRYKQRPTSDGVEILSVSDRIRTVDDAIKQGGYDMAYWYVAESECTSYECPMKLKKEDKSHKPIIVKLWRIRVRLKRVASQAVQAGIEALLKRMNKHSPHYPRPKSLPKVTDPHMLEVSVFDAHFGKLAWQAETGENYDLRIAERVFYDAVQSLVSDARGHAIEHILFPVGQDFLHIDNVAGTTTGGTPQDSDGRYAKIFERAVLACVKAIDFLSTIAPVKVLWVPGNHDRLASYHVASTLGAWYRLNERVTVDNSPKWRKYEKYGPVVLGFTHGDQENARDLVAIMAGEARKLLANARLFEIHKGHFHKSDETVYRSVDTFSGGVRVRTLPSLSGTDQWHYSKGYGGGRAAEAYLWSKTRGYVAHFSANVHGNDIAKRRVA